MACGFGVIQRHNNRNRACPVDIACFLPLHLPPLLILLFIRRGPRLILPVSVVYPAKITEAIPDDHPSLDPSIANVTEEVQCTIPEWLLFGYATNVIRHGYYAETMDVWDLPIVGARLTAPGGKGEERGIICSGRRPRPTRATFLPVRSAFAWAAQPFPSSPFRTPFLFILLLAVLLVQPVTCNDAVTDNTQSRYLLPLSPLPTTSPISCFKSCSNTSKTTPRGPTSSGVGCSASACSCRMPSCMLPAVSSGQSRLRLFKAASACSSTHSCLARHCEKRMSLGSPKTRRRKTRRTRTKKARR